MRDKLKPILHQLRCLQQIYTISTGGSCLASSASSHYIKRSIASSHPHLRSIVTPIADALPEETQPDDVELARRNEVSEGEEGSLSEDLSLSSAEAAYAAGSEFRRTDAISSLPIGRALHQEFNFQGKSWVLETGRLARLADGACTLRVGGTTVLATASWDPATFRRKELRASVLDVDYREKLYAVGRIPTTYNKREGQPKEHESLASRRVERALRPLLPKGYMHDTEILANVLSADGADDPEVMAIVATSTALMCSAIPWAGPVGAVRVAHSNGGLKVNPTPAELEDARMSLLVTVTSDKVVSLEMEGQQVSESELLAALKLGVEHARQQIPPQLELSKATGRLKDRVELTGADPAAARRMSQAARAIINGILSNHELDRTSRARALDAAKAAVESRMRANGCWRAEYSRVPGSGCVSSTDLDHTFTAALGAELRALIIEQGIRPDGRGCIDTRPLQFETDHVPIVHGSALVEAGETQTLCTLTIGSKSEQQRTESLLGGDDTKQLFVHYTHFPVRAAASSRERWYMNNSNTMRFELDRGSLIERSLRPVLPAGKAFPFSVRLNVDALGPDGGSTMSAVAGGCLAMRDANVPLEALCSGVSIALFCSEPWTGEATRVGGWPVDSPPAWPTPTSYELITDPTALELSLSDAELKVAGSTEGVTSCQLETKLPGGVTLEMIEAGLRRAQVARLRSLQDMQAALPKQGRAHDGPMIGSVKVPPTMVGKVIGKEGSTLKEIEARTMSRVDVGDGGFMHVFAPSLEQFERARDLMLAITGDTIKDGQKYKGTVVSIKEFGAFIAIPGSEVHALLHISEVAPQRIKAVTDVLTLGEEVEVICLGRDHKGTIRVSRKAALE